MKKVKTIIFAIGLACMAGCGDDDSKSNDGEVITCRFGEFGDECHEEVKQSFSQSENRGCFEILVSIIEERGFSVSEVEKKCTQCGHEFTKTACPSGYVKRCKNNEGGGDQDGIAYFYGEKYKDHVCKHGWIDVD